MARRRRGYIDPMAFVNQQQQGGGGLKDLASLMAVLGLGSEQEGEAATRQTQAKSQQAQQAYYEGLIGQQRAQSGTELEKLGITKSEAAAAAAERLEAAKLRNLQQQELEAARNRDIQFKEDTLAQGAMEKALEGVTDLKERQAIIGNFNPRAAAAFQKGEEAKKGIATGKFKKGLEQAYKTAGEKGRPGDVAKYLKTQEGIPGIDEIMQDPSIRWQELNQAMPASQPGLLSRMWSGMVGGGGAGTPTAPPVGQGGVTRGYGSVPGVATTGKPLTEIIGLQNPLRYLGEQAKPSVEVVTEKPFSYEEGYPSAKPDYMYGIKTPIPADVINRIESDPRYMSAEQELLKSAMDWWNKGAPAPSGGPSAMPPRILPLGQMAPF